MSRRYIQVYDGDTHRIFLGVENLDACCDCGKVHGHTYYHKRGKLYVKSREVKRSTVAMRRGKRFRGLRLPKHDI